jgi:uncharacterized protein YdeI (YjbR/CyaY-like superfamily)
VSDDTPADAQADGLDEHTVRAPNRAIWRAWLEQNHATRREVWLVLAKKRSGLVSVSLEEAVEEALCFGWIDGKLRRIDDQCHMLRFTPRRADSVWSESNKARVAEMIRQGKMTDAGLALVRAAKESGQWDAAAAREVDERPPVELAAALAADDVAGRRWERLAPSHRKQYIGWVAEAKRVETRRRRSHETVRRLRGQSRLAGE